MDEKQSHSTPKPSDEHNLAEAPFDLGARLRAIRLRHGVGLRELARRLELSPSSISQIETGKIQPSVRTLYAFASEFGVPVDDVLFGDDPIALSQHPGTATVFSVAPEAAAGPGVTIQRAHERPAIFLLSTALSPVGLLIRGSQVRILPGALPGRCVGQERAWR